MRLFTLETTTLKRGFIISVCTRAKFDGETPGHATWKWHRAGGVCASRVSDNSKKAVNPSAAFDPFEDSCQTSHRDFPVPPSLPISLCPSLVAAAVSKSITSVSFPASRPKILVGGLSPFGNGSKLDANAPPSSRHSLSPANDGIIYASSLSTQ